MVADGQVRAEEKLGDDRADTAVHLGRLRQSEAMLIPAGRSSGSVVNGTFS